MRALYFLLAGAAGRLRYLRPGLAVILAGVAVKLLLADVWEFPAWSAPAFITAVLAVAAAASLRDNRRRRRAEGRAEGAALEAPAPRALEAPPSRDQEHAEARR
jgi:tellurite resistance protein TerC